jgi:hypothetical protein
MELRTLREAGKGWRRSKRPSPSSVASVVAHVVVGILVVKALQMPAVFDRLLQNDKKPVAEQIEFVNITPVPAVIDTGRTPNRRTPQPDATTSAPAATVPLVAPTEIPRELPPPATSTDSTPPDVVIGPLRGGSGPTRGVKPNYDDTRVWGGEPEFVYAPKTDKERLDSALYTTLARHLDSLKANTYSPNKFERGDWTFGKEGSKWGIDQQYIRLGRFQIPTALLALLPMNRMQANPIAMERDRNAAYMRNDIMYHAQAAMNEEQFRKAVRDIRNRKERERRNGSATNPGPIASPGEKPPPQD